jgi:RecA-family ATPase
VLIITEESGAVWRTRPALDAEGAVVEFIDAFAIQDWSRFCADLSGYDGDLVLIDCFFAIFQGQSISEAADVGRTLQPLQQAARRSPFAVVITDHHKKEGKDTSHGRGVAGSFVAVVAGGLW